MSTKNNLASRLDKVHDKVNCNVLLNSPVPQIVIDINLQIVTVSESFLDLNTSFPEHLSYILTSESFRKLVNFVSTGAKGHIDLVYVLNSTKESFRTYVTQQEGYWYINLFELSGQCELDSPRLHDRLNLNEALIQLEELQERTEKLRADAENRQLYLRRIIDTLPVFINILDDKGNFMLANKPLADFLGIPIKKLIGKNIQDVITDDKLLAYLLGKHNEVIEQKQSIKVSHEKITLNNEHKQTYNYFKTHRLPFLYKDKKGVLSINTGVDELVETEKMLEHSRQRYKRIFEDSPVGIFHFDNAGCIKRCNQKFATIIGSSVASMLGINLLNSLDEKAISETLRTAIREGESIFEGWYTSMQSKKTSYLKAMFKAFYDSKGRFIGGVCIVEDLTGFVKTLKEKINSENLLNTVFKSLEDVILVVDKSYNMVMCNLDEPAISFDNQSRCHENLFNSQAPCSNCQLANVYKTGESFSWKSFDENTKQHLEVRMMPVKDEYGKVINVVEHIRDVTEHIRIQDKLQRAKIKAEAGERLKTAFLQNISHEIRTPMNSIIGFSELILADDVTDEQRITYGQIIKSNTTWLLNVVDQILLLSKIESNQLEASRERLNFNQTIRDLHRFANYKQHDHEKSDIRIITRTPLGNDMAYWQTNYELFNSMMEALVDNAVKFTEKGIIEIGYEIDYQGFLTFFVKDTGKGISPEHQTNIFLPFRQVDKCSYKRGGNGLGLAIAKGISDFLQGKISVKSTLGQGTIFSVTFPFNLIE